MATFGERLINVFNAFSGNSQISTSIGYSQPQSVFNSYRNRLTRGKDRSIVASIYEKIARDVSAISIKHVQLDGNGRYKEEVKSGLNNCLTLEANIDQTYRSFIMDIVLTMEDEGYAAVFPNAYHDVEDDYEAMNIESLRVGRITDWFPKYVRIEAYNDENGLKQTILLPKNKVAIIENPFYSVMNDRNSILQRLIRKLNLLDVIDEQSGSGKLDLIIQLPYAIKTDAQKQQARNRRQMIEDQLKNSKLGIAYADSTEKITQLNRPLENNIMKQVEYLTSMLYGQFGMSQDFLNGKGSEQEQLNYMNNIVEPMESAITDEFKRKFLSKKQRDKGESILFFKDPFKLVPVSQVADIADKFTRNEIMSSNEVRQIVGMKPRPEPEADELRNKNINQSKEQEKAFTEKNKEGGEIQNGED